MSEARGHAKDEADVRKVIDAWMDSVRRQDIEGILKDHSSDLVMFDVPPPFQNKGLEEYKKSWDLFFSWSRKPIPFEVLDMKVTAGSDVAFAAATMRCAEPGPNNEPKSLNFRLTIGLRKIGGQWTITHEHHSVPAES
jgi:uncharacterized protein (TIGR02246 family)